MYNYDQTENKQKWHCIVCDIAAHVKLGKTDKVLREAIIINEGINKYFFPLRKSFIKRFVFGFWHLYIYRKSEMSYGPKIH